MLCGGFCARLKTITERCRYAMAMKHFKCILLLLSMLTLVSCDSGSSGGNTVGAKITTVEAGESSGTIYEYFSPEDIPDNSIFEDKGLSTGGDVGQSMEDAVILEEEGLEDYIGAWWDYVALVDEKNQEISEVIGTSSGETVILLEEMAQVLLLAGELPVPLGLEDLYGAFLQSCVNISYSYGVVAEHLEEGMEPEDLLYLTSNTVIETEVFYKAASAIGSALEGYEG